MKELLTSLIQKVKEIAYKQGLIADYIIERGVSGIWTYRKYRSGDAVCWGTDANKSAINVPVGYIYVSNNCDTYFPDGLFVEPPRCFATNAGVYGADIINIICVYQSKIVTRLQYPVSYDDALDWTFNIYAIGKWKSGGVLTNLKKIVRRCILCNTF